MTEASKSPEGTAASGSNTENNKKQFGESVFFKDKAQLDAIIDPNLKRTMGVLHNAFVRGGFTPEDWRAQYLGLNQGVIEGKYPPEEADQFLADLAQLLENRQKTGSPLDTAFRESANLTGDLGKRVEGYVAGKAIELGAKATRGVVNEIRKGAGDVIDRVAQKRRSGAENRRAKAQAGSSASQSSGTPPQAPGATGSGGPGGGEPPSGGGGSPENPSENPENRKKISEMNFRELQSRLRNKNLSPEDRTVMEEERDTLVAQFQDFENGQYIERVKARVKSIVQGSNWNVVYVSLINSADQLERELLGSSGDDPRWKGIVSQAVYSEAARLALAGIANKQKVDSAAVTPEWLEAKGYDQSTVDRLSRAADEGIFQLLPEAPELLVGSEAPPQEEDPLLQAFNKLRAQGASAGGRERGFVGQPPPKELVAIFEQGRLGIYSGDPEWRERVKFLDITNPEHRDRYLLLNMAIFNDGITLPNAAKNWQNILIGYWLGDIHDAMETTARKWEEGPDLEGEDKYAKADALRDAVETLKLDLIAAVAISASSQAQVESGGSPATYGALYSGSPDKPNLDIQDNLATYVIHKDPEKFNRMLDARRFPLVRKFYDQLIADSGVTVTEWGKEKYRGPAAPGKVGEEKSRTKPSRIIIPGKNKEEWAKARQDARNGRLAKYLKNGAARGGFNGYINFLLGKDANIDQDADPKTGENSSKVQLEKNREDILNLLRESKVTRLEVWSAAKIATDIFYSDKYARWLWQVENMADYKNATRSNFQPQANWGGESHLTLLKYTLLPADIKQVYAGSNVLKKIDMAFRPLDALVNNNLTEEERDQLRANSEIVASNGNHFKEYMRVAEAASDILATSQAAGVADHSDKGLQGLHEAVGLLNQVKGNMKIERWDPELKKVVDFNVGDHWVGLQVARLIEAKAQALVEMQADSQLRDRLRYAFTMEDNERDPFEKLIVYYWGPQRDGRSGYIANLQGTQFDLIMDERNIFGAKVYLDRAKEILISRSRSRAGQNQAAIDSAARAMVRVFGSIPGVAGRR